MDKSSEMIKARRVAGKFVCTCGQAFEGVDLYNAHSYLSKSDACKGLVKGGGSGSKAKDLEKKKVDFVIDLSRRSENSVSFEGTAPEGKIILSSPNVGFVGGSNRSLKTGNGVKNAISISSNDFVENEGNVPVSRVPNSKSGAPKVVISTIPGGNSNPILISGDSNLVPPKGIPGRSKLSKKEVSERLKKIRKKKKRTNIKKSSMQGRERRKKKKSKKQKGGRPWRRRKKIGRGRKKNVLERKIAQNFTGYIMNIKEIEKTGSNGSVVNVECFGYMHPKDEYSANSVSHEPYRVNIAFWNKYVDVPTENKIKNGFFIITKLFKSKSPNSMTFKSVPSLSYRPSSVIKIPNIGNKRILKIKNNYQFSNSSSDSDSHITHDRVSDSSHDRDSDSDVIFQFENQVYFSEDDDGELIKNEPHKDQITIENTFINNDKKEVKPTILKIDKSSEEEEEEIIIKEDEEKKNNKIKKSARKIRHKVFLEEDEELTSIRKKYQEVDDMKFEQYNNHVNKNDQGLIIDEKVLLYKSKPFFVKDLKELIPQLIKLFNKKKRNDIFLKSRISRLPRLGGLYLLQDPDKNVFEVTSFSNPNQRKSILHNPYHTYGCCFDLPAVKKERNKTNPEKWNHKMRTRNIFDIEEEENKKIKVIMRVKEYENCNNFESRTYMFCLPKKTGQKEWISKGNLFSIIHFLPKGNPRETNIRMVETGKGKKLPRVNPIMKVTALNHALTKPAVDSVRLSKQLFLVKGPCDTGLKASNVYSLKKKNKFEDKDYLYALFHEKANSDIPFLHELITSSDIVGDGKETETESKKTIAGVNPFCGLKSTWDLYNALKLYFPELVKKAFYDTSFEFSDWRLSYFLLVFSCFDPPLLVPESFLFHNKMTAKVYKKHFEETGKTFGYENLPNYIYRDSDDAIKIAIDYLRKLIILEKGTDYYYRNQLHDILCFWHMWRNIEREAIEHLKINNNEVSQLKIKFYELLSIKNKKIDACDYEKNIQLFLNHLNSIISNDEKSRKLKFYIIKNKLDPLRSRKEKIDSSNIKLPDHNHPIESMNKSLKDGLSKESTIMDCIRKIKLRAIDDNDRIMQIILGTSETHDFSKDAKEIIGNKLDDLKKETIQNLYKLKTPLEQKLFRIKFSQDFPGVLSSLGFQEVKIIFKFSTKPEDYKIKEIPDLTKLTLDLEKLGKKISYKVKDEILKFVNHPTSHTKHPSSETQFTFFSTTYQKFMNIELSKNYYNCSICGREVCVHGILMAIQYNKTIELLNYVRKPKSLRSLLDNPNTKTSSKSREKKNNKKHDHRKLIQNFPPSVKENRIFIGENIPLFQSTIHKGNPKMVVCLDNLINYRRKNLDNLCKKNKIENSDFKNNRGKIEDYRYFIIRELIIISKENCIFCDSGELGFVCRKLDCQTKSIILIAKGFDTPRETIIIIHETLKKDFSDKRVVKCFQEHGLLTKLIIRNIGKKGNIINEDLQENFRYRIAKLYDPLLSFRMQQELSKRILEKHSLFRTRDETPGDGNCLFWSIFDQLRRVHNIYIDYNIIEMRTRCLLFYSNNNNNQTEIGKKLFELRFRIGDDLYIGELKTIAGLNVYTGNMGIIGLCNVYNIIIRVHQVELTQFKRNTEIEIHLPFFPNENTKECNILFFTGSKHYQSICRVGIVKNNIFIYPKIIRTLPQSSHYHANNSNILNELINSILNPVSTNMNLNTNITINSEEQNINPINYNNSPNNQEIEEIEEEEGEEEEEEEESLSQMSPSNIIPINNNKSKNNQEIVVVVVEEEEEESLSQMSPSNIIPINNNKSKNNQEIVVVVVEEEEEESPSTISSINVIPRKRLEREDSPLTQDSTSSLKRRKLNNQDTELIQNNNICITCMQYINEETNKGSCSDCRRPYHIKKPSQALGRCGVYFEKTNIFRCENCYVKSVWKK